MASEHVRISASRSKGVSTGPSSSVAGGVSCSPRLELQDGIEEGRGVYAEGLRVSTVVADADGVLISATCMWLWFYS